MTRASTGDHVFESDRSFHSQDGGGGHVASLEGIIASSGELLPASSRSLDEPRQPRHEQTVVIEGADGEEQPEIMDPIPPSKQLTLQFRDVSAWVPSSLKPPSALHKLKQRLQRTADEVVKKEYRQILYNISGCVRPGEVLALMGPSGSGKTSLLSQLGNRTAKTMKLEGDITYNGKALDKKAKRQVGFVMQDDLLYEALTVWETLYFAALLRLPRTMTRQQKAERVTTVLTALGLMKCKDTIIGGFFRRGISGGERKRVSVGHELLINPSILLLDEPTSGLDSTTAMALVRTLRGLSEGGRAIVTTIHQPASRLYQQLDKLLLLAEGHALYYGSAALAADFFDTLGYKMPYGVNIADFILDCASGVVGLPGRSAKESLQHMIKSAEAYRMSHSDGYTHPNSVSARKLAVALATPSKKHSQTLPDTLEAREGSFDMSTPSHKANGHANGTAANGQANGMIAVRANSGNLEDIELGNMEEVKTPALAGSRWGASFPEQIRVLFTRAVKTRRFETLATQDICQFLVIGVLVGMFWWQRGDTNQISHARDITGLLFFELLFCGLRAMFAALFTFPNEFKMMLKERASGMYRLSAFYFARTASDLPMDCTLPSIFICILYFMGGLRRTPAAFFCNWAAALLVLLVSQSLGLLIGASVMVPKTAQTIASVVVLTMTLVGGFYVTGIPGWIAWMRYLSFIFYGYNLLLKIEFGGRTMYFDDGTPVPRADLKNALGVQEDPNQWPYDAIVLIGWLLFFRAWVYITLRRKTSHV